jgi:hypothetical protein
MTRDSLDTFDSFETESERANRDPISGAPGSHPVGTGVGAAGGGAAGAAIGAVGGPVGAVVGAAVGAIAGGLAGKAVAEKIDPTVEGTYWRDNYLNRPYVETGVLYSEYEPAYRFGWESVAAYPNRDFDEVEPELERDWARRRGTSTLDWARAKQAVRDAWNRVVHNRKSTRV